jgi:dTDP-4-amino-4,6-dideoxygalactose transaminase
MIPFCDLSRKQSRYQGAIRDNIDRVLKSGWYILGPELEMFEGKFAAYLKVKHVVGVNSGTDAIHLALRSLGVGAGDEVITVSNTATPTVSAIRMTGAIPVFVDILPDTNNLNPSGLKAALTSKSRAIVPVHLYGYPAAMDEILKFARKHNLWVVEDACQAHGARFNGRMIGTLGDIGCFSFYPTKNLGALGDSGAVATASLKISNKIRSLRNYGEIAKYSNAIEGVNSRLDEVQAALLNWGVDYLDQWNKERSELAKLYIAQLGSGFVELPDRGNLFVIKTTRRDELRQFLCKEGIQTMIHYPKPVHAQRAYRFLQYKNIHLPETVRASKHILSLPLYPEMATSEVLEVSKAVLRFYEK